MCGLLYRRGAAYWLCLGERWEKQRLDLPCYAKKFQNGRMSIQLRVPISFPKTYRRFVSRLIIITYRRASDKHQTSHATIIGMKLIPIYLKLKKLSFAWEGYRKQENVLHKFRQNSVFSAKISVFAYNARERTSTEARAVGWTMVRMILLTCDERFDNILDH